MPRTCVCCHSPRHSEIDAALLAHTASYRRIAITFHVSEASLRRHERNHLHHALKDSQELALMMDITALAARMASMEELADYLIERGKTMRDDRLLIAAMREVRGNVETLARLGEQEAARQREEELADLRKEVERLEGIWRGEYLRHGITYYPKGE